MHYQNAGSGSHIARFVRQVRRDDAVDDPQCPGSAGGSRAPKASLPSMCLPSSSRSRPASTASQGAGKKPGRASSGYSSASRSRRRSGRCGLRPDGAMDRARRYQPQRHGLVRRRRRGESRRNRRAGIATKERTDRKAGKSVVTLLSIRLWT